MYKKKSNQSSEDYVSGKMAERDTMFAEIADNVLQELKKGTHVWEMPWLKNPENGMPENGVSGHELQGDNFWLCLFKQYEFKKRQLAGENIPNPSGKWYTFAQIKDMNEKNLAKAVEGEKPEFIHIRKGEKSTCLTAFIPAKKETEEEKKEREEREKQGLITRRRPGHFRVYNAFNSCQIVGLPMEEYKDYDHSKEDIKKRETELDTFISEVSKNMGVPIKHTMKTLLDESETIADRAYYSLIEDAITVPPKEKFRTLSEYYGTLFHELAHSTGADSRLKRFNPVDEEEKKRRAGMSKREQYAEEEIKAEFTACYLSKYLKTDIDLSFKNNVAYMAIWQERLQKDREWLKTVMDSASKAAKMLLENGRVKTKKEEKDKVVDLTPDEKVRAKENVLTA